MTTDNEYNHIEEHEENGLYEEDGTLIKKIPLLTIYRKLNKIEKNQNYLCKEFKEQAKKINEHNKIKEEQEKLKKDLIGHRSLCTQYRSEKESIGAIDEAYGKGYKAAEENAEQLAQQRLEKQIKFWAKIIIPAFVAITGVLVWLF